MPYIRLLITVLRAYLIGNILSLICILLCSYMGVIGYWYAGTVGRAYSFGFINANECASVLFSTLICIVILIGETHKYLTNLAILTTLIVIQFLIKTRTASLSIVIMLLLFNIPINLKRIKIDSIIPYLIFPVFTALSLYIAINFTNSGLLGAINIILSGRFETWHAYYETFRINAFGNYFNTADFLALDNAYLYLLFRYGIIVYAIYLIIFESSTKEFINRCQLLILLCFIAFEIYGLMEFSPVTINKNVALAVWLCQRGLKLDESELEE